MTWVLEYEDDVASDMSVFHRIDDPLSMPAPKFFAFAARLHVYNGCVAAAVRQATPQQPQPQPEPQVVPEPQPDNVVDIRQAALLAPDWIEVVKAG